MVFTFPYMVSGQSIMFESDGTAYIKRGSFWLVPYHFRFFEIIQLIQTCNHVLQENVKKYIAIPRKTQKETWNLPQCCKGEECPWLHVGRMSMLYRWPPNNEKLDEVGPVSEKQAYCDAIFIILHEKDKCMNKGTLSHSNLTVVIHSCLNY